MNRVFFIIASAALLGACVAPSPVQVGGGSKESGQVVLTFQYNIMQQPSVGVRQGLQTAANKCQSWGYAGAIPSGTPVVTCTTKTAGGDCIAWSMNSTFQCTGMAQ